MDQQILQLFCAIVSVHSLVPYYLVEETSDTGLSGCYESISDKKPNYEKTGAPNYFLQHDRDCWIFSSDSTGSDIRYRLRYKQ